MSKTPSLPRAASVPSHRLSRLTRFGGMVTGVAGGMALDGVRQLAKGQRPRLDQLFLTPANASRITAELSRMRGAAMKVGQLMSMDAGSVLPPEMAEIFGRLRSEARPMPPKQLKAVLTEAWGPDFTRKLRRFDPRPLAAASIGQVHRAVTRDGEDLAIKVQYPGVRESIDSDISNLHALIKMTGMVPKGADLSGLMEEARLQLHEEADYQREARCLEQFGEKLADAQDFVVPGCHRPLTTDRVLAMTFAPGDPIEQLETAPQDVRDGVIARLIRLTLREVFDFALMQTDPNFANYLYQPETGRIVLLDFGATRSFGPELVAGCQRVLDAALQGDRNGVGAALTDMDLVDPAEDPDHFASVMGILDLAMIPLADTALFDVAGSDLTVQLMEAGMEISPDAALRHLPQADLLFLQRKLAGLYLLAARLRAQVPVRALLGPYGSSGATDARTGTGR